MHEAILRDFFVGAATVEALRHDLAGAVVQTSSDVFSQHVVPAKGEFEVTSRHLIRLCDAVLEDGLPAQDLETVAFCLIASDFFHWDSDTPDGCRVSETLFDWDSPEINYPLTKATVAKFRSRLVDGRDTFTRADVAK